jgi:hypothetical protein
MNPVALLTLYGGRDPVAFSGTPVQILRTAIEENAAVRMPLALPKQAAGFAALC